MLLLRSAFGVLGAAIVFANVVATKWVWASDLFDRSQKIGQTALIWVVPGGVVFVWRVLREPRIGNQRERATAGVTSAVDWFVGTGDFGNDRGSGGSHDGGNHGTFDHGGHHGSFGGGGHDGGGFGGHGGDGH